MLVSHAKNIIFVCSKKKYSFVFRMKEYIILELRDYHAFELFHLTPLVLHYEYKTKAT